MNIQYRGSQSKLTETQLIQKADTYADAFGNDEFWKEGYVDANGDTITLTDYELLLPIEQSVYTKMYTQIQMLELFGLLGCKKGLIDIDAVTNESYAGGIRGYETRLKELQSEKLKLDANGVQELSTILGSQEFTYLSELFVSLDYRGQGVSSQLLDRYIQEAESTGLPYILTRTTTNKPNPAAMFESRGFEEVYRYSNDPLNRALFLKALSGQK